MKLCVMLAIPMLLSLSVSGYSQQTIEELLSRYDLSQKAMQSKYVKSETTMVERDSQWNEDRWFLDRSELYVDGDRMDLSTTGWSRRADREDRTPSLESSRAIWDGAKWYEYRNTPKQSMLMLDADQKRRAQYYATGYAGGPVEGVFLGDWATVSSILHQAGHIVLRDQTENVQGVPCYVLESTTVNGTYRIWIDPEHGYNICQAEVVKGRNDLFYGEPVSRPYPNWSELGVTQKPGAPPLMTSPKAQITFTMKNVRFERSNGIWVPVAADWELKTTHEDNRVITRSFHYACMSIDLSPDFNAAHAFVSNFPDGTRVFVEGENPVIQRYWKDGKAQLDLEEEMKDALDTTIAQLQVESETPKEGASPAESQLLEDKTKHGETGIRQRALSEVHEPRSLPIFVYVLGCSVGLGLAGLVGLFMRRRRYG